MGEKLVAIAPFLRSCPRLITLGVRASMGDYTTWQRETLLSARKIFFPTPRFVRILEAAGKKTFPSGFAYSVQKSRLIQEALYQVLKCPHPFTRIYYGRQKSTIPDDFPFPVYAMGPDMIGKAWLVSNSCDLGAVSEIYNPLIIQEVLDYRKRFLLVFINYECAGIVKKEPCGGECEFHCSGISANHPVDKRGFPKYLSGEVIAYIEKLLRYVQLNDIAVEIGLTLQGWQLIELVRPPLSWPSAEGVINRYRHISRLIESNRF
jgi:ribosomal protein S6--L-glutamate ligase